MSNTYTGEPSEVIDGEFNIYPSNPDKEHRPMADPAEEHLSGEDAIKLCEDADRLLDLVRSYRPFGSGMDCTDSYQIQAPEILCREAIAISRRLGDAEREEEALALMDDMWSGFPNGRAPDGRYHHRIEQQSRWEAVQRGKTIGTQARVPLDYNTDGTAWYGTILVQGADGNFFIESAGSDQEGNFSSGLSPWSEAQRLLRPLSWVKAMREVARLRGQDSQDDAIDDDLSRSLINFMRSSDRATQDWAITAISSIGSIALPLLVEAVVGEDPALASVAVRALIAIGKGALPAVPMMVSAYSRCDASAQEVVIHFLSQVTQQDGIVKTIIELAILGYERDRLMAEARRILDGQSDLDDFVQFLSLSLRHPDEVVRKKVLLALYQFGRNASLAVPAIQELLGKETNALIRRMAGNTLASIKD